MTTTENRVTPAEAAAIIREARILRTARVVAAAAKRAA